MSASNIPTLADTADLMADRPTALIVDPDQDSAGMVMSCLKECELVPTQVTCAVDAVIAARRIRPSVIFIAAQLRDATVRELSGWLRANPNLSLVPLVVMYSSDEDLADIAGPPFEGRMRKPLNATGVRQLLANLSLLRPSPERARRKPEN
jgi:CheY-like chemotaxis protein